MQSALTSPWFFPLWLLNLLVVWVVVALLVSYVGGWHELAARWRTSDSFDGEKLHFRSCRMRWGCSYNGCLTLGANSVGLYLSVWPLLRLCHPPLFVPWEQVSLLPERRGLFFPRIGFVLDREKQIAMWIQEDTAKLILAYQTRLSLPQRP